MVSDLVVAFVEAASPSAGESVAEDDSLEVVGLVLEAAGQLSGAGQLDGMAVLVRPRQIARSGRASSA